MKYSVSTYSYNQAMRAGRLTLEQAVDTAAEQGYQGVEFVPFGAYSGETAGRARALGKRVRDAGMEVVCYLVGNDFLAAPVADCVEKLTGELRIAEALGAPLMRHDASAGFPKDHQGPSEYEDALPTLVKGYAEVTRAARGMGIRTCVENHGYFCQDSARVKALIDGVNDDNFGWLVDVGNFMCADEPPESAVAVAAPYAVHAHAKDFRFMPKDGPAPGQGWFKSRGGNYLQGTVVGQGAVPVARCVELLTAAGYDKWLTLEFEGPEDCVDACARGLSAMRGCAAGRGV